MLRGIIHTYDRKMLPGKMLKHFPHTGAVVEPDHAGKLETLEFPQFPKQLFRPLRVLNQPK